MSVRVPFLNTAGAPPQVGALALVSGPSAFLALTVLMTTSAFYFLFVEPSDGKAVIEVTARNNPAYLALWVLLYGWAALLVGRDVLARGFNTGAVPLAAFGVLALLSVCWSSGSGRTLIYATMLAANFLVGYALAVVLPPERFLKLLGALFAGLLVASLVLLVVAPGLVTNVRWGGGWIGDQQLSGVFAHKSDAGYYFAALSLLIVHGGFLRDRIVTRGCLFIATVAAILMSNSATALMAALMLNAILMIARRTGPVGGYLLPAAVIGTVVFSVALPLIDIGNLVGFLGREASLTGRVPIWNAGLEFVAKKPLLGYGYGGFFDLSTYSPAWDLWKQFAYFKTPHFHNSAIEILVSLGIVGLAAYIVVLAVGFLVLGNRTVERHSADLLAALLVLFVISAAFDFTFIKHNAFATTLLAYACIAGQRRYA